MKMQPYRKEKLPGRTERCPCGSGKKAKKCCLPAIKEFAALPQAIREQIVVSRILRAPNVVTARGGTPIQGGEAAVTNETPQTSV